MAHVLVLHGPNLDRLGTREPWHYGSTGLDEIHVALARFAETCGLELSTFQTNAEHEMIGRVHAAADEGVDWILLNPAGWTHTSVALRDAVLAAGVPFVEVHLSNPVAREPFRHHSYFSDIAQGTISGFGPDSYLLALQAVVNRLDDQNNQG